MNSKLRGEAINAACLAGAQEALIGGGESLFGTVAGPSLATRHAYPSTQTAPLGHILRLPPGSCSDSKDLDVPNVRNPFERKCMMSFED